MSSGTSFSARPTSSPLYSPSLAGGRTPTSNLKASGSPSESGVATISMLGSPIGLIPVSSNARSYHSGSASRIASSKTGAKPSRWITSEGGALPWRKPGIRISFAIARAAREAARSTSLPGTSTSTRTRESGSSVREVSIGADPRSSHRSARRRTKAVRSAAPKSIAKARPLPAGPVTNQARALSSGDTGLPDRRRDGVGREDLPLEPLAVPGRDRPLRALGVELDAAILGEVEQALLLDPLARRLEEEPGEQRRGRGRSPRPS